MTDVNKTLKEKPVKKSGKSGIVNTKYIFFAGLFFGSMLVRILPITVILSNEQSSKKETCYGFQNIIWGCSVNIFDPHTSPIKVSFTPHPRGFDVAHVWDCEPFKRNSAEFGLRLFSIKLYVGGWNGNTKIMVSLIICSFLN